MCKVQLSRQRHTIRHNETVFSDIPHNYVLLTNKIHFLNQCFNSVLLVFYIFRTSYVRHQEDSIVHAQLTFVNKLSDHDEFTAVGMRVFIEKCPTLKLHSYVIFTGECRVFRRDRET